MTKKLILPDPEEWEQVILLKYAITDVNRSPAYHVIRIVLSADGTVLEENPGLPYKWTGTWEIQDKLDMDWLVIRTGDYLNVII